MAIWLHMSVSARCVPCEEPVQSWRLAGSAPNGGTGLGGRLWLSLLEVVSGIGLLAVSCGCVGSPGREGTESIRGLAVLSEAADGDLVEIPADYLMERAPGSETVLLSIPVAVCPIGWLAEGIEGSPVRGQNGQLQYVVKRIQGIGQRVAILECIKAGELPDGGVGWKAGPGAGATAVQGEAIMLALWSGDHMVSFGVGTVAAVQGAKVLCMSNGADRFGVEHPFGGQIGVFSADIVSVGRRNGGPERVCAPERLIGIGTADHEGWITVAPQNGREGIGMSVLFRSPGFSERRFDYELYSSVERRQETMRTVLEIALGRLPRPIDSVLDWSVTLDGGENGSRFVTPWQERDACFAAMDAMSAVFDDNSWSSIQVQLAVQDGSEQ